MNDAAEALIRFYCSTLDPVPNDVDQFIEALNRGTARNEADAFQMRDTFINGAMDVGKGTNAEDFTNRALALHLEIESTKETIRKAQGLEKIADIIENRKPGPFAERIAASLIKKAIEEM